MPFEQAFIFTETKRYFTVQGDTGGCGCRENAKNSAFVKKENKF